MPSKIDHIITVLRQARLEKGLSQKALGLHADFPQSHISNIEKGSVDLQTSTLVELARLLDLEVMLVPRKLITTVDYLIKSEANPSPHDEAPPLYQLDEDSDNEN